MAWGDHEEGSSSRDDDDDREGGDACGDYGLGGDDNDDECG